MSPGWGSFDSKFEVKQIKITWRFLDLKAERFVELGDVS